MHPHPPLEHQGMRTMMTMNRLWVASVWNLLKMPQQNENAGAHSRMKSYVLWSWYAPCVMDLLACVEQKAVRHGSAERNA